MTPPTLDEVDPRTFRTAWRRTFAFANDLLIVALLELVLVAAFRVEMPWDGEGRIGRGAFVIDGVVGLAYPILLHRMFGRTVGKWLTGVRLVALDLGPITWIQAVVREAPWIALVAFRSLAPFVFARLFGGEEGVKAWWYWQLGAGPVWVLVDLIVMLSSSRRRALHDRLARTVVVRVAEPAIAAELRPAVT